MVTLTDIKVSLKIPGIGGIEGTWKPNDAEKNAAWEMYVELITRVSVVELKKNEGLLREALSSIHSLFDTTRKILREYGPTVAQQKNKDELSFGHIAIIILNIVNRPFLAKWHPILEDYENNREDEVSILVHEKNWDKYDEFRASLEEIRLILLQYTDILSDVADVPSLIEIKEHMGCIDD